MKFSIAQNIPKELKFKIMIKSIITANSLQMIRAHFILFFHTSARSVKLSPQKLKLSHQNLNQKYSRYECTRFKILVIFFRSYMSSNIFYDTFFRWKKVKSSSGFSALSLPYVYLFGKVLIIFCAASFYHIYFVCLFVDVFVHTTV